MIDLISSLHFLASVAPEPATEFPSLGKSLLYGSGIAFIFLLSAFFVARERLARMEGESAKPQATFKVFNGSDGNLTANQIGVIIASLALGFLGEPFVSAMVSPPLQEAGLSAWSVKGISLILAISIFTLLHVVIGQLINRSVKKISSRIR